MKNARLGPSCCSPALTAAAAWSDVEAERLGEGEGREGECADSPPSPLLLSWWWLLLDDIPDKAAASLGDTEEEDEAVGWVENADEDDAGGGDRAEGGSELRSGMAVPSLQTCAVEGGVF